MPSGVIQAGPEQVLVRVGGQFDDAESIAAVNLRVGERFFNLGDVASVRRGYQDPPQSLFRYNGKPAIGLQVGMREGENILEFGKDLDALMSRVAAELPVGIEMAKVADQPHVVDEPALPGPCVTTATSQPSTGPASSAASLDTWPPTTTKSAESTRASWKTWKSKAHKRCTSPHY